MHIQNLDCQTLEDKKKNGEEPKVRKKQKEMGPISE
jgi:hypothetical protein